MPHVTRLHVSQNKTIVVWAKSAVELSMYHLNKYSYEGIYKQIQSNLVISKSKGPSDTLRDIRTSTYQMCGIEENTNRTTKFHK